MYECLELNVDPSYEFRAYTRVLAMAGALSMSSDFLYIARNDIKVFRVALDAV